MRDFFPELSVFIVGDWNVFVLRSLPTTRNSRHGSSSSTLRARPAIGQSLQLRGLPLCSVYILLVLHLFLHPFRSTGRRHYVFAWSFRLCVRTCIGECVRAGTLTSLPHLHLHLPMTLPLHFEQYRTLFSYCNYFSISVPFIGLQCFDAVGWAAGRASGL